MKRGENLIHLPIMVDEVLKNLLWNKKGVYIDATVGLGGHTLAILKNSESNVIGIDLDKKQIKLASERLRAFGKRVLLVIGNYGYMDRFLNIKVDGILFDFGISSYQLDDPERGFSYRKEGPLDMRYGKGGTTAKDIIENWSEKKIAEILYLYGEEKFSKVIAQKIKKEIPQSTSELALIVRKSVPRERAHKHLSKVFQALRIAVNEEFLNIEKGINSAANLLKEKGKLVVITYHSKEEKLVCSKTRENNLKFITKKPILPSKAEFLKNPRCRSAHLRVFEK
ncbi:MAG: 16S rRNA (cytosine(1402)-N(4))-methyltransferase RsmH [candidate division WOR-3 bacterium]